MRQDRVTVNVIHALFFIVLSAGAAIWIPGVEVGNGIAYEPIARSAGK